MAVVPDDTELGSSAVPAVVDLPWELLDGCGEAMRGRGADLVPAVVAAHTGRTLDGLGRPLSDAAVETAVRALMSETRGRLRALTADVSAEDVSAVGVVSWLLLADGWRSLHARHVGDERRVEVRRVEPAELAPSLAPVLVEVSR